MDSTAVTLQAIGTDIVRTFTAIVVETFLLVLWGFDITNFIHAAQITLIHNPDLPMAEKYITSQQKVFDLLAPLDLIYAYMALLGDGIVVWRVVVLWGHTKRRWVIAIPFMLLVGSLGTKIIDGSFQSPAFCKNVQTATYSVPTATTAVATVLIGWKTWEYHQSSRILVNASNSVPGSMTLKVEKVLLLLVESGILYFLFFLIIVIGNIPGIEDNTGFSFAFFIYSYSTSVVVGLYPTAVIILTHSQTKTPDGSPVADSLQFSSGAAASTLRGSIRPRKATHPEELELSTYHGSATDRDVEGLKPGIL
ncbi:hypothetical protein DXG01_005201 [Tephrocybe rancida]|nr:hypothetical protein DXG01_005201 [Tephrocybe rancida]